MIGRYILVNLKPSSAGNLSENSTHISNSSQTVHLRMPPDGELQHTQQNIQEKLSAMLLIYFV